ncbi:MAG: argininosuccinate lyase [Candidatus Omnitrophota bacterium]|jgi:argininosuccinate lyase
MAKKLWGGRFSKKTDPLVEEFTKSIQYDYKLMDFDIIGSLAHIKILYKAGYLSSRESSRLENALNSLFKKIKKGCQPPVDSEDVHTYIQNELQKKVGDLALKLHTARSRNDQVAFATKLYCYAATGTLQKTANSLVSAIKGLSLKNENKDLILPGFTHLQHAQPVYLKDYLGAYILMLKRDISRLESLATNLNITLGAGALAGTPIMSSQYNENLKSYIMKEGLKGWIKPVINSLDSVSDRDFLIEIIAVLSIIATHLSRLAEDLIIWSTKEFDFVEIDEAFCTGSSLMPQKKNPDVLELIRGYAGRLYGNLVSVLTMMKGLPLTYNRDMQLDKEPLFNSFEVVSSELKVLTGLIKTLKFNKEKIEEQLKDESLYATDLVYYLVDKKIPFKNAHTIIGKLVKYSLDNDMQIKDMPEGLLQKFSAKLVKKEIVKLFKPLVSVKSKKSIKR